MRNSELTRKASSVHRHRDSANRSDDGQSRRSQLLWTCCVGIGLALSALYQVSNSKSLPMREISYSQQTSRFYEAPPERQASTRYEVPLTYSGRKTAAKTLDTRKR